MITKELVEEVCKNYEDPELGIDIWTLGLIYGIEINKNDVKIKLTFTSPMCPFGPQMVEDIKREVKVKGAEDVDVEVTFDPPWQPSEELREMMGV
jgi:metal-sulfur cluster biosynthetic enzyme